MTKSGRRGAGRGYNISKNRGGGEGWGFKVSKNQFSKNLRVRGGLHTFETRMTVAIMKTGLTGGNGFDAGPKPCHTKYAKSCTNYCYIWYKTLISLVLKTPRHKASRQWSCNQSVGCLQQSERLCRGTLQNYLITKMSKCI